MNQPKLEDIRYAIVGKNEHTISLYVDYWIEGYDFKLRYQIDLPVNPATHEIPSGQELNDLIMHHAPLGQLTFKIVRFKQAPLIDYAEIDSLIVPSSEKVAFQVAPTESQEESPES